MLRKDTADLIGNFFWTEITCLFYWINCFLAASWGTDMAKSFDMSSFKATHIEKLSWDNTHEEKERVMSGLRTG